MTQTCKRFDYTQVTFTFTLRKTPDQKAAAICRKEATFTFKKDSDNRGWRECVPSAAIDDGLVYLTVEVMVLPSVSGPLMMNL